MILSSPNQTAFQEQFTRLNLPTTVLNSVVKLTGQIPTSGGGSYFTGSGVIFHVDDLGTVWIASALHNLWIFAGEAARPTNDPSNYTDSFQQHITILYGPNPEAFGANTTSRAQIAEIIINTSETGGWQYDVMIIKSADAALLTFAQDNLIYALPSSYQGDQGYFYDAKKYLARGNLIFLQAGYGTTRGGAMDSGGPLQYRFVQPSVNALADLFYDVHANKTYDIYSSGIQLGANANDTTAPGDSGGPLIAVLNNKGNFVFFLIGVTTGADMVLAPSSRTVAKGGKQSSVTNNFSTSLTPFYQLGLV